MLNTLLSSLVTYFQTVVDTAYFEDGAPNSPDTCVYLVEYSGGSGDDFSSNRKVQINVRGLTNSDAKQTAWALYKSLNHGDGDSILEILGGRFLICSRLQPQIGRAHV